MHFIIVYDSVKIDSLAEVFLKITYSFSFMFLILVLEQKQTKKQQKQANLSYVGAAVELIDSDTRIVTHYKQEQRNVEL